MKNVIFLFIMMILVIHSLPLEKDQKVVMYWDSLRSFTEDEHSLSNWLKGKTANASINSKGEIEMTLDISGFPHVLSSPELNIDCESFDAMRITYINLLDYPQGEKIKIAVGWVDEILTDKYLSNKNIDIKEEERIVVLPLKSNGLTTAILQFKGHKNWKKGVKIVGLNLGIISDLDTIEGKFLISSIELIKFNK